MKLQPLALLIAAGLALGSDAVSALGMAPDGIGDAVLIPYFTVEDGQATLLTVTNHSDAAKAVRIVYAESRAGRPTLAMNLYLAPRDSWKGSLSASGQNGPARLFSTDESCTAGDLDSAGEELRTFAFAGNNADGLGSEPARTQRGFIEVIEMGELTGTALANTAVKNCASLSARITSGDWSSAPNNEVSPPTGGISAQAHVVDVAQGTSFRVVSHAVSGFSGVARHAAPGASTNEARLTRPLAAAGATDFEVEGWGSVPVARATDAISLLFMSSQLEAPYSIAPTLGAETRFFVTMPTRHAYVDSNVGGALPAGSAPIVPFSTDPDPNGPHCEQVQWRILRDDGSTVGVHEDSICASVSLRYMTDDQTSVPSERFDAHGLESGRAALELEGASRLLAYQAGSERFAAGLPVVGQSIIYAHNANAQPGLLAAYAITYPAVPQREQSAGF
jgi:hypothetical protein